MKTPALVSLLVGVLLLGASLATNAWQFQRQRVSRDNFAASAKLANEILDRRTAELERAEEGLRTAAEREAKFAEYRKVTDELCQLNESMLRQKTAEIEALRGVADVRVTATAANSAPRVAAPAYTPAPPSTPAMSTEELVRAVSRHAERYFKTTHQNGSGATLVFDLSVDLDAPREVPGWSGRYEVRGVCSYQFYDSVWGGSFRGNTQHFSAYVDTLGGASKIASFDLRSGPAM